MNKQPDAGTYTDTVLQAQSHMPGIHDMVNAKKKKKKKMYNTPPPIRFVIG